MGFELEPLAPSGNAMTWIILDAVFMLVAIIVIVRLTGLRAFAKMSSFDFAVTVATGSVLAAIVLDPNKSVVHGTIALGTLLLAQAVVSYARNRSDGFETLVDNEPLLLMEGANILDENLRSGRVSRDDLVAKLREANVTDFKQVHAVVLETTGDISVLHGDPNGSPLASELLNGVRREP